MRRIALLLVAVSACYAQDPCSYLVSTLQLQTPPALNSCGLYPFSQAVTWTWSFVDYKTNGAKYAASLGTWQGLAYCSGLAGAWCGNDPYTGFEIPRMTLNEVFIASVQKWSITATVTTEKAGGNLGQGYGCAGLAYNTPLPPTTVNTPCCKDPGCTGSCLAGCDGSCRCSPIVIDTTGNGLKLTDVTGGVQFRVDPGGQEMAMAWTDQSSGNGWLWLDRNGNGIPDDFTEFFGSSTPQPKTTLGPNGYLALAVFDRPENGGNGNGVIDKGDKVFHKLSVWIDANQDGVPQPHELHSLASLGIASISLKYTLTDQQDDNGNILWLSSESFKVDGAPAKTCDVMLDVDTSK
jgi:hypothetical protein